MAHCHPYPTPSQDHSQPRPASHPPTDLQVGQRLLQRPHPVRRHAAVAGQHRGRGVDARRGLEVRQGLAVLLLAQEDLTDAVAVGYRGWLEGVMLVGGGGLEWERGMRKGGWGGEWGNEKGGLEGGWDGGGE